MLKQTLLHIPGIGLKTEKALWSRGIRTWWDYQEYTQDEAKLSWLQRTRLAYERDELSFFLENMPRSELYRIVIDRPQRTAFLDIETTGLSSRYHNLTLIGVCVDGEYRYAMQGQSTDLLNTLLESADCLVTFNGTRFDLPFLRRHVPDLHIPEVHIDLLYLARRYGYKGGQKAIEKALGFSRPDSFENTGGESAPALWYRYMYGDNEAGRHLVVYNYLDIVGMHFILDKVLEDISDNYLSLLNHRLPEFTCNNESQKNAISTIRIPKFPGKVTPTTSYSELRKRVTGSDAVIVGIDLSGSEARASGWSHLIGNRVTTDRIFSNAELIDRTLRLRPDLVSIDSPLSLPVGRTCITDDDPAREEFGITRACERTLKRRGVNVYPCLIRSMQTLTQRGIGLASRLRSAGIPVIESFPGAAQDIIGMPRKGVSLDMLKEGLEHFGLEGDFRGGRTTHDEIDAITSALVGVFFFANSYEPIGNEDEDYLIVPEMRNDADQNTPKIVVGLSGPTGTGKTTAAHILEKTHGFLYTRFSQVLANILRDQGEEPDRLRLQEFGQWVHENRGQRWLCAQVVRTITGSEAAVVDGLRYPEDYAFFVERFGNNFKLVYIDSPDSERHRRFLSRDDGSQGEYTAANAHPVEQEVDKIKELAHLVIDNTGTVEQLRLRLEREIGELTG